MKEIAKTHFGSFWVILFLLLAFGFALSLSDDVLATSTCANGYCYDTGTTASGGTCGDPTSSKTHWDTCFGLSWQFYKWPKDWNKNIVFYGSEHSGRNATVDKKCKNYGGFWFLGYEAYTPSTGVSKGYQIARPKASMLKDYNYNGHTPLYPFDSIINNTDPSTFKPKANPYIPDYNSGLSSLKGKKYGTAQEVKAIFDEYVNIGADVADTDIFADINWFCAEENVPVDPCLLNPELCPGNETDPCLLDPANCPDALYSICLAFTCAASSICLSCR